MSLSVMEAYKTYIKKVTGFEVEDMGKSAHSMMSLPVFITEGYKITPAEIHDHQVVFVQPKGEENPTPSQIQKQLPKIEQAFDCHGIMVFDSMSYYLREELTHSRISFIVPDEQLFIPFMFMALDEQKHIRRTRKETLSPATQCMLIYHLWKDSIEDMSFQEIAELMEYTPRTIGRCARELENFNVCKVVGSKPKYLRFERSRWEVWETAKEYMESPVKKPVWVFDFDPPNETRISGINALSNYSNLSPERNEVFALEHSVFKKLGEEFKIHEDLYMESGTRIEVWNYDPVFLSRDEYVDPLSLYLTLQYDSNERVQMELDSMLRRVLS